MQLMKREFNINFCISVISLPIRLFLLWGITSLGRMPFMKGCGCTLLVVAILALVFGIGETMTPNGQQFADEARERMVVSAVVCSAILGIPGLVIYAIGSKAKKKDD